MSERLVPAPINTYDQSPFAVPHILVFFKSQCLVSHNAEAFVREESINLSMFCLPPAPLRTLALKFDGDRTFDVGEIVLVLLA